MAQTYNREKNGRRFIAGSMNTVDPLDALAENEYAYLQNVRSYTHGRITGRSTQSSSIATTSDAPHSIRRLNDETSGTYVLVIGAAGKMYVDSSQIASGLSTSPLSLVQFRPNSSVVPWMYSGDSAVMGAVTISTKRAIDGSSVSYNCAGMLKVRSDGLVYKVGIAEPQSVPTVGTENTTVSGTDTLQATSVPWTNYGNVNTSYNYGQTLQPGSSGAPTAPVIISTPTAGATLKLTVSGSATVNGSTAVPSTTQANTSSYPGYYNYPGADASTSVIIGAFTDGSGNVIPGTSSVHNPVDIGSGGSFTVPSGASQFQIGIDSSGNTASANSGFFNVSYELKTSAITDSLSTYGTITLYYWGDSSHSVAEGVYSFRNPNDSGTATERTASTATGTATGNAWIIDATITSGVPQLPGLGSPSTAPQWSSIDDTGAIVGATALSGWVDTSGSQGNSYYGNLNGCFVGAIFVPTDGDYTFVLTSKDSILWGIDGATFVSGTGQWTNGSNIEQTRALTSSDHSYAFGQTMTVIDGIALLPNAPIKAPNGSYYDEGHQSTVSTVTVNLKAGTHKIEIDYDYWYHSDRILLLQASPTPGATPTIIKQSSSAATRTNVSYAYRYRSSLTGAVSNPSPYSTAISTPLQANTVSSAYSTDPQVDKVDYFRQDSALANYTYVATGPNDNGQGGGVNTAIIDQLSDTDAAGNSVLENDNFEPFPSIDLPRSGVLNVVSGVLTRVSGDYFNTRWLPGTVILIGAPTQLAYTLTSRPTSTSRINLSSVPDGTNLTWNIAEPKLAAQPLPSIWGPTDNSAYMFACYDPLRPGTLYYTMGNNPDSAPDTNQIEVTSPSEPLMNGAIVNGVGMVFSTERAWIIYPTFSTALATVNGVSGQAFNLVESITNRGLYIRTAICTEAGKNVFFRGKDGIYVSPGGSGSQSLTDAQIYNLFPHEGHAPSPITIAGSTIYPPDDTKPDAQKLHFSTGYLYYDYEDTTGTPHTLVFDTLAKGWSVDVGIPAFTTHADGEGDVHITYVGGSDGTVRSLSGGSSEAATSIVATGSVNAGDARANKRIGDVFIKALVAASNPITVALYSDRYATALSGFSPTSVTGSGSLAPHIVDFTSGEPQDVIDIASVLSWNSGSSNYIDLWQPDWIDLPESIQDRASDWDDCGTPGNKFVMGLLLECNTYNVAKTFSVQRSDDNATFTPLECPVTVNGQTVASFTFSTPFLAHLVRLVSTDGVPWQAGPTGRWRLSWLCQPYPESSKVWTTESTTHGLNGYMHIYQVNLAYIATEEVTLTMTTDEGTFTMTFPATSGSSLMPSKILVKAPRNKFKVISYSLSSTAPFYLWKDLTEVWVKQWNSQSSYLKVKPFGGATGQTKAEI